MIPEENRRRVIVVCMKDKNPYHYTDTKTLLEFGFNSFKNTEILDPTEKFSCAKRLVNDKIIKEQNNNITAADKLLITLPAGADEADITVSYDYNVPASAPDRAAALMKVYYGDYNVGSVWLINDVESNLEIEDTLEVSKAAKTVGITAIIIAALAILAALITGKQIHSAKKEKERRQRFKERQKKRLAAMGMSEDDFNDILKKRAGSDAPRRRRARRIPARNSAFDTRNQESNDRTKRNKK